MLDIKAIRENPENFKKALAKKRIDPVSLDNLLELDKERRFLGQKIEELSAHRNALSKEIPKLTGGEKEKVLAELNSLKEQLKELEPKRTKLDAEFTSLMATLPNPPHESVPHGKDDSENCVIATHGKKPHFAFEPKDHLELGKTRDWIAIEPASRMSGTRFYYLKNDAVRLEFALIQFVLSKLAAHGFTPILPPTLVKEHAMFATGFFPADRNEIYHVNPESDDLFLVGTAEVPLCMYYADQILPAEKLPMRFVGFSTCYRREAGSYGKDTHGIFRVHQFDKVEMFSFCDPDKSWEEHEFIRSIEEEIMRDLGFHYQVVNICGGDLGAPAAKKYDIEVWIPSQKRFRELTSCSNCTDFQARRANIRMRDVKGNVRVLHTLNGTAMASTRTIVALMENYQKEDGTIALPECVRP